MRWSAADRGAHTFLVFVLMVVALLVHCAVDGPSGGGSFTAVAAVAYPNDPVPEAPPVCPNSHPLHDGAGATVLRTAAAADLASTTPVVDRVPACSAPPGPTRILAATPPDTPGGASLCLELCVSRR